MVFLYFDITRLGKLLLFLKAVEYWDLEAAWTRHLFRFVPRSLYGAMTLRSLRDHMVKFAKFFPQKIPSDQAIPSGKLT